MLKVRYYRIKVSPAKLAEFNGFNDIEGGTRIRVLSRGPAGLVLKYIATKHIHTLQILDDGSEVRQQVPVTDQFSIRLFANGERQYLSIIDPPRGAKPAIDVLTSISGEEHFIEQLTISKPLIDKHISHFEAPKLVSAKIRDFQVTENAVGRLEVSSKSGLMEEVAPFLVGKYYRIDSLSYEVLCGFQRGLITYSANGTVRASEPLVEHAFPAFERVL